MELEARSVISRELRPDETILWCGRPNPAIRFSKADAVHALLPFLPIALSFYLIAGGVGFVAAAWIFALPFCIIFLMSLRSVAMKMRDKKEAFYAITDERILIVRVKADGGIREIQSTGLRRVTKERMSRDKSGTGTIVFFSGHSTRMYRNNPMPFYDIDNCERVMKIYRKKKPNSDEKPRNR